MSLLVLSDLHVGSKWALWPPGFRAGDEGIPQNSVQRYLWKCWTRLAEGLKKVPLEAVFFLGENIDGPGTAEGGRSLKTRDLLVQRDAFLKCVEALGLPEVPKFLFASSAYHKGVSRQVLEIDQAIADALGARFVGYGPWDYRFRGKTISFRHGEGGTYWYRGTKLDKAGFEALLAEAGLGWRHKDLIVFGHLHFYGWLRYGHQTIATMPCWQVQTDWMRQKAPYKFVPDIGAIAIVADGAGELRPMEFLYRHPERVPLDVLRDGEEWSFPRIGATPLPREAIEVLRSRGG